MTSPLKTYDITDFAPIENIILFPIDDHSASEVKKMTIEELDLQIPDQIHKLIKLGDDPIHPRYSKNPKYKSRSECTWKVMTALAKMKLSITSIAGICINPEYGISERFLEKNQPAKEAFREAKKATVVTSGEWPDITQYNKPKATMLNAYTGIKRLEVTCSHNIFRNRKFVTAGFLGEYSGEISDKTLITLRKKIIDTFGFDPKKENLGDAIETLCYETPYHPIRTYLNSLTWDKTPRIKDFLHTYLGAKQTELNQAISTIMFIAAVRRIRKPGCKFDTMVVLEGKQGSGKSTALRILAGNDNFSDQEIIGLDSKTQMELLEGVWIYEASELSGLKHTEVAKMKSFLSRTEDRGRPAYARYKENTPRQSIIIGTTNDTVYLKDRTGNRRFLPVETHAIDLAAIEKDRDLLWAEAVALEAQGQSIILPKALWHDAGLEQHARLLEDPWLEALEDVQGTQCGEKWRVSSNTLLIEYLQMKSAFSQVHHSKRLAECMNDLGWNGPKKLRINGMSVRGYERDTPVPQNNEPSILVPSVPDVPYEL
ncbi:MAG: virulence protein E [Robiginitomaculum sp.]|nr:MAG: virulence protein E [Robiginitomaculum sp.]